VSVYVIKFSTKLQHSEVGKVNVDLYSALSWTHL